MLPIAVLLVAGLLLGIGDALSNVHSGNVIFTNFSFPYWIRK